MNNISTNNIFRLFKFNLLIKKHTIIGWSIAIFSIMFMYMILFPFMEDMAQVKMEAMPKEILQLFGLQDMSDMSNFTSYYGSVYALVLVALAIFSATFSAGLITKEEGSRSIEFLDALSVSRTEIYISKYFTSIIGTTIILINAFAATIICGLINGGQTFSIIDIIASSKITSFSVLIFGGIAIMLAGLSSKIATNATVSIVVLICYMLGFLGQLLGEHGEFLLYCSPFITLNVENAIAMRGSTILAIIVYMIIYISALIIGCIGYNKRDFNI